MLKKTYLIYGLLLIFFNLFSLSARAEDSFRSFFIVENISCSSCIRKIDAKLKTLAGYHGMLTNIEKKMVIVDHKKNLSDTDIASAITSIGKPARLALETEYDGQKIFSKDSAGWRSPSDGFVAKLIKIFSP